jgi:hypothetical protein
MVRRRRGPHLYLRQKPAPGLPWIASAVQPPTAKATARGPSFSGEVAIERAEQVVQPGIAQQDVAHSGPPSSWSTKEGTPSRTDRQAVKLREGSRVSRQ